jgi:diacylglycerol kinase family enzyme
VHRLQLVVNPSAGRGRAGRLLPSVQAALQAAGHDVVVSPTRSLGHAGELAGSAAADDRVAVALGGDGTVGRVAAAVADSGGLLGVLPGGRGNDFCRAAGLPLDAVAAARARASGR